MPQFPYVPNPYNEEGVRVKRIAAFAYEKMYQARPDSWRHSVRIAELGRTVHERVVGYCHDLVEDRFCTIDDIPELLGVEYDAIALLTRPPGPHDYQTYIQNIVNAALYDHQNKLTGINNGIGAGSVAARVKFHDLCDNLHPDRGGRGSVKHVLRYTNALTMLALALQPLGAKEAQRV